MSKCKLMYGKKELKFKKGQVYKFQHVNGMLHEYSLSDNAEGKDLITQKRLEKGKDVYSRSDKFSLCDKNNDLLA